MRYIGNKTKLLDFIRARLRRLEIGRGVAVDPFSGTASVARMLKREGWRVIAGDIMRYAFVFARAYVELDREPDLSALAGELRESGPPTLAALLRYLERLEPKPGFIHEHYSPGGAEGRRHGRMYFTAENAARIDAIRERIAEWLARGLIDEAAQDVLLAALIEGADRVANTTGVYAAFVKSWQPNALARLRLRPAEFIDSNGHAASRALQEDAEEIVAEAGEFDLLYLDPPYNTRQYAGYYHIPELLAEGWFDRRPDLRGKTGLIPDGDKRSDWSRRGRCEAVFERLVARAPCRWIVMSYNDEGIIRHSTIAEVLREYGQPDSLRCYKRRYRRYRADEDSEQRNYRGDRVTEHLYVVQRRK
ncbi:MAG: DNA adenine methylase [Gemmatimonadetes bacterium]|nr:DNA adenine methylase [Gemmatimonadota bacterium]